MKIQSGRESKMAADAKNSKTNRINFSPERMGIHLSEILPESLEGPWCLLILK